MTFRVGCLSSSVLCIFPSQYLLQRLVYLVFVFLYGLQDANRFRSGDNGGPGGTGGRGGRASSGAAGGAGGMINVQVSDSQSYLLMAVQGIESPSKWVQGGKGGTPGKHGKPGSGGPGGSGGSKYTWTDSDGHRHSNSGGRQGSHGIDGIAPTEPLYNGKNGLDGDFNIFVASSQGALAFYACRYDLEWTGATLYSDEALSETSRIFLFGDTVWVTGIEQQNIGAMPTPPQPIELCIASTSNIIPNKEDKASISQRAEPWSLVKADGKLSFFVDIPNIRAMAKNDMEPYRVTDIMFLHATQLGPHGFARPYDSFDVDGTELEFRFPVENGSGFEGLPSMRAGNAMRVKFALANSSLYDLGITSTSTRQLFVQFYRNPAATFDVATDHIELSMNDVSCLNLDDNRGTEVFRGTIIPIELLETQSVVVLTGLLRLSHQVSPYSNLAIQAEIVLQDLGPKDSGDSNKLTFLPIQRRQLEIVCEPSYFPSDGNKVVLVSSSSTKKAQFEAWRQLLTERITLSVEYYSVSIYGSLHPDYMLPNGKTLAQAFSGKLVVVLDEEFNPIYDDISRLSPSCMLPRGCMSQTSGFDESTKWLLVGSSKAAIKQALSAHYTAPPSDKGVFESISAFQEAYRERLNQERSSGKVEDIEIREDIIDVRGLRNKNRSNANNFMQSRAASLSRWLKRQDPLRQHIIEPRIQIDEPVDDKIPIVGTIVVRRGYCRTTNSTMALNDIRPNECGIHGTSALLAISQALQHETLIAVFCHAIRHGEQVLMNVCQDAFTTAMLWDVANFLDGYLSVTEHFVDSFPSIATFMNNKDIKRLLEVSNAAYTLALSTLFAHLNCVADSKDLRPWWCPWSRKYAVRGRLFEMLDLLKCEWSHAISDEIVKSVIADIEGNVYGYMHRNYCIPTPRLHGHWRKVLTYLSSHRNKGKYPQEEHCAHRLIEMETSDYRTKTRAIHPVTALSTTQECQALRDLAQRQQKLSKELFQSIKEARNREIVTEEDEIRLS